LKTILLATGLLLCMAMFPRLVASAVALVVIAGLLVATTSLCLSVLFAPPRPR
jgi:hypothetical protein